MSKVAIIGLDGASPGLVFERWRSELPNLSGLMRRGAWGELRSVHPPITVPAWAVMFSGRDPGQLGLYGLRNRRGFDYSGYSFAASGNLPADMVWDVVGRAGQRVVLLGVPPSYPPRAVNGWLVSCFLTPSPERPYTHPPELRQEIETVVPGYVHDVEDFRTDDKEALLGRIHEKTRQQFALARHLLTTRPWDLFAMVEMGVDRIHHGFWRYCDPEHPQHPPGHRLENAVLDYYRKIDDEIGRLLAVLPDDATVLVLSDHGARALHGCFCFNEWLMREGYLVLRQRPTTPVPLTPAAIDWERTRAWGDGGYYGRLFLNVRGREPQGIVAPADVDRTRDEIAAAIAAIEDPDGRPLGCRAHRPEDLYAETRGVPPDLMVYFGDLRWRAAGGVGYPELYAAGGEIGPDDANHDWDGIFILRDGAADLGNQRLGGLHAIDIARTVLARAGVEAPESMGGRAIPLEVATCAA